jgi:RNA polymerase sigma-70 factor (ECF subfamily)
MAYWKKNLASSARQIVMLIIVLLLSAVGILTLERSKPTPTETDATSEESLLEAVRKARAGDKDAFNLLYQWYSPQIYRHLYRMVGNPEDASELAADAFLKAWLCLPGLRDELKFRGWLFSIATRKALDFFRQRRGYQSSWECLGENITDEQAEEFERRVELDELVALALKRVAPKPRTCLLLQLEGFSYAEIANMVGLGPNSVGTYVSIAKEQFRQAYHQYRSPGCQEAPAVKEECQVSSWRKDKHE